MSPVRAGLIGIAVVVLFGYWAYTQANPFASPFELQAVFRESSNLQPRSPVRVAGIQVGEVTSVESLANGTARVRMELEDRALPVHEDAELKIRPRIFLEGNFFVDLHAGSPSAAELDDGATIPLTQTAAPVQLGDVLADLQSDTRSDLQVALAELAKGLDEDGATGLRQTVPEMEPAYRNLALAADATLGEDRDRDQQRALSGTQRTAAAFARDERALQGAVVNLSETVGALSSEDAALRAAVPALRDTLRASSPALAALNGTLPPLRSLAREALPGVRRAQPVLEAALPAIRQARALVSVAELRGAARVLRREVPSVVDLVSASVPLFEQGRAASRCTERVLVPLIQSDYPDPDFPENTGTVNQKLMRSLVGLAGESRLSDGNQSYFHVSLVPEPLQVRPAPPPNPDVPPPHRPDVPCETQEAPNLDMPAATVVEGPVGVAPYTGERRSRGPAPAVQRELLGKAHRLMTDWFAGLERKRARLLRLEAWR
jgi:virulence factor Mce-like protein